MNKRFSKTAVMEYLERRLETLEKEHHFDPRNGWAQVAGKGEEKNRAYGEYAALDTVLDAVQDGLL